MKAPLFIRPLSTEERRALQAGRDACDAFTRRRCRILLANAEGMTAAKIAASLGCALQTALNALNAFAAEGLDCLAEKSHSPKTSRVLIAGQSAESVGALLHRSPREFGKPSSVWSFGLVAEVAFEQGITDRKVSEETIRQFMKRLGVDWSQAKRHSGSPRRTTPLIAGLRITDRASRDAPVMGTRTRESNTRNASSLV